jgi:hypothetical protein
MRFRTFKGEEMKMVYLRILLALVCFVGLSVTAEAQGRQETVMTLSYEFVAGGKTLPAGKYIVTRISDDGLEGLILSSYENRTTVVLLPTQVESAPANKPSVSFERVGDLYFLSKIQTSDNVYSIHVSRSAITEAAARLHDGTSASGSSGSN